MKENQKVKDIHSKKSKKSRIITIILVLLINLGIVGFIVGRELSSKGGSGRSKLEISTLNPWFTIAAIAGFGLALFAEYMKYRRMILSSCGRLDRRGAFQVATYGKYADNVTPLGAGGQPFQIHFLHKRGYPGGASTSVTMNGFLSQQFAFIVIAIIVLIVGPSTIEIPKEVLALRIVAYVGLGFYSFMPLLILAFAIFPKPITAIIMGILKLGYKMHIVKDYETIHEKLIKGMKEYTDLLKQAIRKPSFLIPTMFWAFVYQMSILCIPFFTIRAFGGTDSWWYIFVITINVYLAITIIPTPGNSGAAESTFYIVFSVLETGAVFWAMIFWRFLVYYSWIIIGLIVVVRTTVKNTYKHMKEIPSDRALNICLVCEKIPSIFDDVMEAAKAYQKLGHNVVLLTPERFKEEKENVDYEIISLPSFKSNKPYISGKLIRKLEKKNFDLIHIFSPYKLGRRMRIFGRKHKIPTFATFYLDYSKLALNNKEKKFKKFSKKIFLHFYHRVDTVWAIDEEAGEILKAYGFNRQVEFIDDVNKSSKSSDYSIMIERYIAEAAHPN